MGLNISTNQTETYYEDAKIHIFLESSPTASIV